MKSAPINLECCLFTWYLLFLQYMDKAPRGKHSTKGLGKMVPDPSEFRKLEDEVTVPVGKPVPSNVRASELMYNEYIVYDTSQVSSVPLQPGLNCF